MTFTTLRAVFAASLLWAAPTFATAASVFGDARVAAWSEMMIAGNHAGARAAVEQDLASETPSPLAPYIWSQIVNSSAPPDLTAPDARGAWAARWHDELDIVQIELTAEQIDISLRVDAQPQALSALWALASYVRSLKDRGRKGQAADYFVRMATLFPNDYEVVWLADQIMGVRDADQKIAGLLQSGAIDGSPVAAAVARRLRPGGVVLADQIEEARAWVARDPGDARAIRRLGHLLRAAGHNEEALAQYRTAQAAFPFFSNAHEIANVLGFLSREEDAKREVAAIAAYSAPTADAQKMQVARWLGAGFVDAGNHLSAFQTLENALATHGDDADILLQLAKLMYGADRNEAALGYAERARTLLPLNGAATLATVRTLNDLERSAEVISLFDEFTAAGGALDASSIYQLWKAHTAKGDHAAAAALAAVTSTHAPDAAWIFGNFMESALKARDIDAVVAMFDQTTQFRAPTTYRLDRLATALGTAAEGYQGRIEAVASMYPDDLDLAFRRLVNATRQQRLEFWQDAATRLPLARPAIEAARLLTKDFGRGDDGDALLDEAITRARSGAMATGQLVELLVERASVFEERVNDDGTLSPAEETILTQTLSDWDEALRLGLSDHESILETRFFMLRRARLYNQAATALVAWERDAPETGQPWRHFFDNGAGDVVGGSRKFVALNRLVRRGVFSEGTLQNGMSFQVRWGGSPLMGLRYAEWARRFHPDYDATPFSVDAMNALGLHQQHYVETYQSTWGVGRSDRYIGWFERARATAMRPGATLVSLDLDTLSATTIRPDGIEVERRWEADTARLIYRRVGAAFVEMTYTEHGDLTGVIVNGTTAIQLGYEPSAETPVKSNIVRYVDTEGQEFSFTYDDKDRVVRIKLEGDGEVIVGYDEAGEIADVENTGSPNMSFLITQAFSKLQETVQQAADGVVDPDLIDLKLDALLLKMEETPYHSALWSNVVLSATKHYAARIADQTDYASEGLRLARSLVEAAQDSETGAEDTPRMIANAIEGVDQWRIINQRIRPEGVPIDQWTTWTEMMNWVRSLPEGDEAVQAARAALDSHLADAPLRFRPERRWLANDRLANLGFWKTFGPRDVLPAPLANDGKVNDLIIRASGDVVAATSAGIAVMRAGFWEWFGFDEETGRFTATLDYTAVSPASDLHRVVEDGTGVLWFVTRRGLAAIPGAYDGPVTLWSGEADGIPGGEALSLTARHDGVVLGARRGFVRWTMAGAGDPLPGAAADEAALFAHSFRPNAGALPSPESIPFGFYGLYDVDDRRFEIDFSDEDAAGITIVDLETGNSHRLPGIDFGLDQVENIYTIGDRHHLIIERSDDVALLIDALGGTPPRALPDSLPPSSTEVVGDDFVWLDTDGKLYATPFTGGDVRQLSPEDENFFGIEWTADHQLIVGWTVSGAVMATPANQFAPIWMTPPNIKEEFYWEHAEQNHIRVFDGEAIAGYFDLATGNYSPTNDDFFLVGTEKSLLAVSGTEAHLLIDEQVTDAWWDTNNEMLWVIQGTRVLRTHYAGGPTLTNPLLPPIGVEEVRHSGLIYGFSLIEVDGEQTLAIRTDLGLSIWKANHFEHLTLPTFDSPQAATTIAADGARLFAVTPEGVAAMLSGQTYADADGRVHEILTAPGQGLTYIAQDGIMVVFHDGENAGQPQRFSYDDATTMALDRDGALITHDGLSILSYAPGETTPRILFDAEQSFADNWTGPVRHILAASDGTVWVAAGPSLFRHKDGETQEFKGMGADSDFISPSHFVSRVWETVDGKIWVVLSDEGHITYENNRLDGGLYVYRDGKFFKHNFYVEDQNNRWFVTAYMPLDDNRALLGTSRGFAIHYAAEDRIEPIITTVDETYGALRADKRALFLGRGGAHISEDTILMGSNAGILAYSKDGWFYPDRVNRMLPGQEFSAYGARVVHSVATDPQGRIYAGTDIGLMIFDPLGAGAEGFLMSDGRAAEAFGKFEQNRMESVSSELLDALPANSRSAKQLAQMEKLKNQLSRIEADLERLRAIDAPSEGAEMTSALKKQRALTKKQAQQLLRLERENPALFHMVDLKPLDLRALSADLPNGVAIVQYLPTDKALYINLVTNEGGVLKSVEVAADDLFDATDYAAAMLEAQTTALAGGGGNAASDPALNEVLHWLYRMLMAPIEGELAEADEVLIVPAGLLNYLPFHALVRDMRDGNPQYAVEAHTIGYLPTTYFFDVMRRKLPTLAEGGVIFGDSDGSLPNARTEASRVAEALDDPFLEVMVGEDATFDALTDNIAGAKILHLAVHGKLDARAPEKSYLQLAGYRLSMADAMVLPLDETDLVFLSACETGVGGDGQEFRTIAHAFAHAGAPTVIATLWRVQDDAALKISGAFYDYLSEGQSKLQAMALAQRQMIEEGGAMAHPASWSPFVVFGRTPE